MKRPFHIFIGVDISIGAKPVTFIAFDSDQQVLAIGEGDVPDILAYAAGQTGKALVAVNAAAHPNNGRMARAEVRSTLTPPPARGKFTALRQAEYELIQAGMPVPETPDAPGKSLPWVRRGFALVELLQWLKYRPFPENDAPRQWLEVNADAAFWSLLDVVPLQAGSLEGRIQRQLALLDQGLKVPDAMEFFEELTRYKILKSSLPTQDIFPQAEINAWIAAYTAWLAVYEPGRIRQYGDPDEGLVFLPCKAKR